MNKKIDKNVKNYTFIYFCKAADNSFASTPSFFFEASSLATTSDSQSDSGSSSLSTDPRRDSDLGLTKILVSQYKWLFPTFGED